MDYTQIIKYLYTCKDTIDPLLKYLLLLNKDYLYYYLMFHPEVFGDDETFNKFMQLYLLHHTFRNETIQSYHNGRSPTFDYNLNNKIYDNIEHKYDKTRRNKNIKHTIDITINLNNQEEETRQDARVKYKQIYDRIRQRIHKQFPSLPSEKNPQLPNPTQSHDKPSKEKYPQLPPGIPDDPFKPENPITSNGKIKPRKITNLKQVDNYLKQQEKQIKRHHRQIQKNLDNCVSWRREMMKTKNKPQYKRWNRTPNDATRHTCNDGQIVPLDKKFIVVNEKTGEVDYLNYPGDWSGSPANVYNCLCEIDYDDKIIEDGIDLEKIPKYKDIKKEQKNYAKQIQEEIAYKNKYHDLKTIDDVAKYYNLEVKKETNELHLTDKKHDTEIVFDKYYTIGEGSEKYIDMKNEGNCKYDFKEVIKIYNEAPEILKDSTNIILFPKTNPGNSICGYTQLHDSNLNMYKTIEIYEHTFNNLKTKPCNLRQTMYHEMGHTLDLSMMTKKSFYGISSSKEWTDTVTKERKWYEKKYKKPYPSSSQYGSGKKTENWAETVSMVAMKELSDKSSAKLEYKREEKNRATVYITADYKQWMNDHPYTSKFASEKIYNLKKTEFKIKKELGEI